MLSPEKLARINELARKSRTEGLTQAEKDEQTLDLFVLLADFFRELRRQRQQGECRRPESLSKEKPC